MYLLYTKLQKPEPSAMNRRRETRMTFYRNSTAMSACADKRIQSIFGSQFHRSDQLLHELCLQCQRNRSSMRTGDNLDHD